MICSRRTGTWAIYTARWREPDEPPFRRVMSSSETPWSNHGASASTLGGYSDRRADTTDTTTGIRNRSLALVIKLRLVMQCFLPVTSPSFFWP